MRIIVKFEGGQADEHRIPAYDGSKSLRGISRSLLIVSNYLVEGKVRRKNFEKSSIDFFMITNRAGSYETVYEIAYTAAVFGGGMVADASKDLLKELIKTIFKRVLGQENQSKSTQSSSEIDNLKSGDLEALTEAIEPALRNAHTVINNNGVTNICINVKSNDGDETLVDLTSDTKQFVWGSVINDEVNSKLFSVASFNANEGSGRAFDLEGKRNIPFQLVEDVDSKSINTILDSISSYARYKQLGLDINSTIALKYTSVDSLDGRRKKIQVLSARKEISEL